MSFKPDYIDISEYRSGSYVDYEDDEEDDDYYESSYRHHGGYQYDFEPNDDLYYNKNLLDMGDTETGYYGETTLHYQFKYPNTPTGIKTQKIADANSKDKVFKALNNPALPEWAVLPQNAVVNKGIALKFADATVTPDNIKIPPAKPSYVRLAKVKKVMNPDKEVDRLKKRQKDLEEFSHDLEEKIKSCENELKVAQDGKKKSLIRSLNYDLAKKRNNLDKNNSTLASVRKNIGILEKVTPEQKKAARDEYDKIIKDHEDAVRDYKINVLSFHYPSKKESERLKAARSWAKQHPEFLDSFNNTDLNY